MSDPMEDLWAELNRRDENLVVRICNLRAANDRLERELSAAKERIAELERQLLAIHSQRGVGIAEWYKVSVARQLERALHAAEARIAELERPTAMLLFCPRCEKQHIDAPEPESGWTNPPHATHTCKFCGLNWRPSNAMTNGVAKIDCLEPKHAERIVASQPSLQSQLAAARELLARAKYYLLHDASRHDLNWQKGYQIVSDIGAIDAAQSGEST